MLFGVIHQVGNENFALGLGTNQHGNNDIGSTEYRTDQHWHREAHMPLDGEIRNQRWDQTREDHSGVVAETAGCGAHLGWETLGNVT